MLNMTVWHYQGGRFTGDAGTLLEPYSRSDAQWGDAATTDLGMGLQGSPPPYSAIVTRAEMPPERSTFHCWQACLPPFICAGRFLRAQAIGWAPFSVRNDGHENLKSRFPASGLG